MKGPGDEKRGTEKLSEKEEEALKNTKN